MFESGASAHAAARRLPDAVPAARVWLLGPKASLEQLERLPTDEGEQPGMGAAVGGVVGAASAMSVATLVLPPAGVIAVLGLAGSALLGAAAGMKAGDRLEDVLGQGVPRDELRFYEDELRRGHSLVVAVVDDEAQADVVREVLRADGSARIDPAREDWSVGIRD